MRMTSSLVATNKAICAANHDVFSAKHVAYKSYSEKYGLYSGNLLRCFTLAVSGEFGLSGQWKREETSWRTHFAHQPPLPREKPQIWYSYLFYLKIMCNFIESWWNRRASQRGHQGGRDIALRRETGNQFEFKIRYRHRRSKNWTSFLAWCSLCVNANVNCFLLRFAR